MKKNNHRVQAYTLIELLVGITIIGIVFTIGYASFREFSRRQALSGIVKKVTADLRLAQQLSLTGQKPEEQSCITLIGYTFIPNTTSYTLTANCSDGNRSVKTVDLEDGVGMSGSSVQFKILGEGTNLNADTVLTITQTSTGAIATINIGKGGEIK